MLIELISDLQYNITSHMVKKRSEFDVFICYHSGGGGSYAEHLWKTLPHIDIRGFLDKKDIPDEMRGSERWREYRDNAILNCKHFILIMTIGFNIRDEIKRELELALNNDIDIIFCRHASLDREDCVVRLESREINIYDEKQWHPFYNESDLYNKVATIIKKGKERINQIEDYELKKDLFENFFEHIYSDIQIFVENYQNQGYHYNHNTLKYDKYGGPKRLKLDRYKNQKLRKKINKFYRMSDERHELSSIYNFVGYNIINQYLKDINESLSLNWKLQTQRKVYMDIKLNIDFKNGDRAERDTSICYDLLHKKVGAIYSTNTSVKKIEFSRAIIHIDGGAAKEIFGPFFWDLWKGIIKNSEENETFESLRNGVTEIISLGEETLKEIMEEFSEFT